ncbi:flagellar basal body-associated FliL family protein [Edaphobacter bradus]|uniref:flagellar basal body-associated FliL family protein n=1 Tax=Edaphobacter bradus TaxID=2259016 RepID=UPI0021E090A2|nr:flagellar basal body-associated FliL family protein [Edaphobacter bradus]
MATAQITQPKSESGKVPLVAVLIAVVLGTTLSAVAVVGALYYFVRSGRLPLPGGAAARVEPNAPVETHATVLEPLLVNLADEGGAAYLRIGISLSVADVAGQSAKAKEGKGDSGKQDKGPEASLRDTALAVLGSQTSAELLAPDGKERLKSELKQAFDAHNPEIKVVNLYFTDFLVQR